MKRKYGLLKYDLKQGMSKNICKYVIGSLPFWAAVFLTFRMAEETKEVPSFFDCLFYLFEGIEFYVPEKGTQFEVPVLWLSVQIFICIIICYYPKDDLEKYGTQSLLCAKSKLKWWISKSIWLFVSVSGYYIMGYCIVFLSCAWRGKYGFLLNKQWNLNINEVFLMCIVIPVLTSFAFSAMQMSVSFIFNPIYSFLAGMAYLVISVYYNHVFFFCGNSMILRNRLIDANGRTIAAILTEDFIVILISEIGGYLYFRQADVIRKNV